MRRFILDPQPLGRLRGVVGPSLDAQIEAREMLEALAELKPWQREALLAVDQPASLAQYAKARGMHPGTAASRLRLAREALALRLRRPSMNDREKRRVLTDEDLSFLAERARALESYAVRPWDRERLWTAVLGAQMEARTRREREAVAEVRGALQILDAVERHFARKEGR
ncbi:hypothetical protein WMF37_50000 [Sorangium sp. So ce291]|uniref:hypothetical protein n=1 Tax=Sorangium sp. So ce291 TaxID=3133294 RepID=UPI003F6084BC